MTSTGSTSSFVARIIAYRRDEARCRDVALVSPPLCADGRSQPASSDRVGAAIDAARPRKQQRYPELARPGPQRLIVLAAEDCGVRR